MISVTILTKNSSYYLKEVLEPLGPFDEVLIYDTGSQDNTLKIASSYGNVTIYKGSFIGFGPTHNCAAALARNDWILSLDSDEVATPELVAEILSAPLSEHNVYTFRRENIYNGKVIRGGGWSPDRQRRLYHRGKTSFDDAQVHEKVILGGLNEVALKGAVRHYSYRDLHDFLHKMQHYSDLFAKQYRGKRSSSPWKALWHGLGAFLRSFFIKKGFCDGYEGFVIASYNASTALYKYLKLYEANRSCE